MVRSFGWAAALVCAVLAVRARAAEINSFLPKETDVVLSLNVRQVLDSPLVKKHALELIKTTLASSKEAQEAIKALGLDPLTDFSRVSVGVGLDDVNHPKAVIIIEGKFDPRKIGDVADALVKKEPKQFSIEKVNGKTVYKISAPDQPVIFAAPIDTGVFVLGTQKEYVGAAFDAAKGTRKPEIKKELAELIKSANPKSSLTVVANTKGRLDAIPLPDAPLKKTIEQIHSFALDLKVDQDVDLEISIGTENAEAAKQMQLIVAGGLDLAKIQAKVALAQQPELQPLLDLVNSLKAVQKDKDVVVTGKLGADAIEKILKKEK
jgi:hypothetical protein